jgi:hypothetical protein
VVEIPVTLAEKRPPSIALFRRVPNVLKQVVRLFWVLRVHSPPRRESAGSASGSDAASRSPGG